MLSSSRQVVTLFHLHIFLRLTRALCRSLVVEGSVVRSFCQTVVVVCSLLLQEKKGARVKDFAVAPFRKRLEIDPSGRLPMAMSWKVGLHAQSEDKRIFVCAEPSPFS